MTDSQEKKANDSQESQRINIEFPGDFFEGMFRMMSRWRGTDTAGSDCCETPQNMCCPQPQEDKKQEYVIVIKRKER
ncbi:MAG: hypothetical protein JSU74_12895 [Candidatus Zixiibacteriota bacterium]|nr:MAG: hypothetical protein JSU74_12895 [candidate division Zixibacteria bacterium]